VSFFGIPNQITDGIAMCKSSALAFVLLWAFIFRLETPSIKLILIILTMTIGVIMMVAGETAFEILGFILVILSAFFSGFRWALTQILLLRNPATSNPFSSIFFLTPITFLCLFLLSIPVGELAGLPEGFRRLAEAKGAFGGVLLMLFPGTIAFCMMSAEYALLKRTSVVTLSICGIFKEVLTISAAQITYHDKLTPVNISGLVVTIASIGAYNYIKISKMRRNAREMIHGQTEHTSEEQTRMLVADEEDNDKEDGVDRRQSVSDTNGVEVEENGQSAAPRRRRSMSMTE
jgi:solute carrier family 35, member C2